MAKKAKAKKASAPRKLVVYRTYQFKDQDPIIDYLRKCKDSANVTDTVISDASGVSVGTMRNWFGGKTKRPQFATIAAAAAAMGENNLPIKGRG